MAQNQKSYDNEFKSQAVKLAQEIGGHKAAQELGIPKGTIYTWIKAFKEGKLVVGIQNGSGDFRVVISWYKDDWSREQIVVQKFDDEARAIQVMKKVKKFVYNKLGE